MRTSYCTRIVTLYGAWKVDSGPRRKNGSIIYLMLQLFWEFVVTESKQLVYTHTLPFIPNWLWINILQIQSRLVTMSASLCTQTGYPNPTIQILNIRVYFIDIWCTSLTSVQYNLEHGLAIITESFSPVNMDHTTSFVKIWIRSHTTSHAIPDAVYLPCTLN